MHLEIHHHEHQGDMSVFKCKVIGTYKRSLDRQVAEGVELERSEADLVLNSRAEFHGSAVPRVTVSHDTRDTRDTYHRDTRDTHQSSQPGPGARQRRRPGERARQQRPAHSDNCAGGRELSGDNISAEH